MRLHLSCHGVDVEGLALLLDRGSDFGRHGRGDLQLSLGTTPRRMKQTDARPPQAARPAVRFGPWARRCFVRWLRRVTRCGPAMCGRYTVADPARCLAEFSMVEKQPALAPCRRGLERHGPAVVNRRARTAAPARFYAGGSCRPSPCASARGASRGEPPLVSSWPEPSRSLARARSRRRFASDGVSWSPMAFTSGRSGRRERGHIRRKSAQPCHRRHLGARRRGARGRHVRAHHTPGAGPGEGSA